jgi:hypothetical protein
MEVSGAEIVKSDNYIDATKRGCLKGLELKEAAIADGTLRPCCRSADVNVVPRYS